MFAGKKSAQIREILINESAWEEMTCLFAPSLGDAVVEVAKQGRPINTRTLLDYIEGNIKKKSWLDNKELLQTAISVLKDNQNLNGKM